MINGLAFTGRETMLTKGMKKVGENIVGRKQHEYLSPSKIYGEVEQNVAEVISKNITAVKCDDAAKSYAISHGIPESAIVEKFGTRVNFNA